MDLNTDDAFGDGPVDRVLDAATVHKQLDHLMVVRLALELVCDQRLRPDEQRRLVTIALSRLDLHARTLSAGWASPKPA